MSERVTQGSGEREAGGGSSKIKKLKKNGCAFALTLRVTQLLKLNTVIRINRAVSIPGKETDKADVSQRNGVSL